MTHENDELLEKIVLTRLVKLNGLISGIVTGIIAGLVLFIATNILVIRGGDVVGPHLALLGQFFWGYTVTFIGSLVGLFYGFITGFMIGYAVALLYNWILKLQERWEA